MAFERYTPLQRTCQELCCVCRPGFFICATAHAASICDRNSSVTQRKHEELGLSPYVAHATFQYSGTPGKRHRMREAMLFEDPPEYYKHPKGFIALK